MIRVLRNFSSKRRKPDIWRNPTFTAIKEQICRPATGCSNIKPGYIALFEIGVVIAVGLAVVITSLFMHYRELQHARQEIPVPRLARERESMPEPACKSMRR